MSYKYNEKFYEMLKFKFNSSEKVKSNYSWHMQDIFVLTMLNGKRNGFFLEIGANNAFEGNNTYLLEKEFGWRGLSVERDSSHLNSFKERPSSSFVLTDALSIDYEKLFSAQKCGTQIDYLSLDIEPPAQTLAGLKKLPLDKYRFSVITYETDFCDKRYGMEAAEQVKRESREIFSSYGYEMIVGNLNVQEDWYVDPTVVDKKIIDIMKSSSEFNADHFAFMLKH